MADVIVVGAQWGDEGKGKVVDWLSARADVVVRFQGGHNAGHTLVIEGERFRLSLLPSGCVRPGKLSVIGPGVVLDPWAFMDEIARLGAQGANVSPRRLRIAENIPLILPYHRALDSLREDAAGDARIGTTRSGIGPAYEDKIGRRAIRLCDLADPETLRKQIARALTHHNALRRGFGAPPLDAEEIARSLLALAPALLPYADPVWLTLHAQRGKGARILYEGAQGAMLDVDFGTYPFVTSSSTLAGQALAGSGLGRPKAQGSAYVLGILKAYTTRVGAGPFPTELVDETGRRLGERGHEFGTVTGRKRRCGWFDATMVREAALISGMDGCVLTKLDVLDGLQEIKICTGYRLDGEIHDRLPRQTARQARLEPIYETHEGWDAPTRAVRSRGALPLAAQAYIARIETLIARPITMISTSPEREDMILLRDPFED